MYDSKRYVVLLLILILALAVMDVEARVDEKKLIGQVSGSTNYEVDTGYGTIHQSFYSDQDLLLLEKAVDPDEYILGPNDKLMVSLVGPEPRTFQIAVLPEGFVFIPGMGEIKADGLTLTEFRSELSKEVEKYFRNIRVFCYLYQPRAFRVFVTGEVARPGAVEVSAVQRVSDAIDAVGSIESSGTNRQVLLERDGKVIKVDILRFVLKGDFSANPFLSNGDRIHVPVAGEHAIIRGSVKKAMVYEVIHGETVADLIDLAGGFSSEALRDTLLLSRVMDDGTVSTIAVSESDFEKTLLRDRDEINVMDGMTGSSRVYVFGATSKTGRYYITDGEELTELLGRIGSFDPYAALGAASIERADGEIIRLDLGDYISSTSQREMELKDGDMLHIPRISTTVAVGGQVQLPGRFNYEGDWTVAQYVGLAGGPTEDGSINRVVIFSVDGRSRKGDRNTHPNRGDVIIVKRSKTNIFGGFFKLLVSVGTVVISVIILTGG